MCSCHTDGTLPMPLCLNERARVELHLCVLAGALNLGYSYKEHASEKQTAKSLAGSNGCSFTEVNIYLSPMPCDPVSHYGLIPVLGFIALWSYSYLSDRVVDYKSGCWHGHTCSN